MPISTSSRHRSTLSVDSNTDETDTMSAPDQDSNLTHVMTPAECLEVVKKSKETQADVEVCITNHDGTRHKKQWDGILHEDGRREIREHNCYDRLGYCFPQWKKWGIIAVIFMCQLAMNFNVGFYPSSVPLVAKKYDISIPKARVSQMIMMVCFAFGCEFWSPWSEVCGRRWTIQLAYLLTDVWQLMGGFAPNYATVVVARALTGLSNAGGTIGVSVVSDLWEKETQGYALLFITGSMVGGTAIGPIFGGLASDHLTPRWFFWIMLIVGGFTQLLHFLFVPETQTKLLMDREAKRRRRTGEDENIWGPGEIHGFKLTYKEFFSTFFRPFNMMLHEPVIFCLSWIVGFSNALIFIFYESYIDVYKLWGFTDTQAGVVFVSVLVGYIISFSAHLLYIWYHGTSYQLKTGKVGPPESRLLLMLILVTFMPIGLFIFGWTAWGPEKGIPWIAPTIGCSCVAIANFSINMAVMDYTIVAYGSAFSASAIAGNGFFRDLLAGIAVTFSEPLVMNIGKLHFQWAGTLLGCIAILACIPIYWFYFRGPVIRKRSKMVQGVEDNKHLQSMSDEDYEKASNKDLLM